MSIQVISQNPPGFSSLQCDLSPVLTKATGQKTLLGSSAPILCSMTGFTRPKSYLTDGLARLCSVASREDVPTLPESICHLPTDSESRGREEEVGRTYNNYQVGEKQRVLRDSTGWGERNETVSDIRKSNWS